MSSKMKKTNNVLEEEISAFNEFSYLLDLKMGSEEYWVKLENQYVLFNLKLIALFPNFFNKEVRIKKASMRRFSSSNDVKSYGGFPGFSLMTLSECKEGFFTRNMKKAYYRENGFQITEFISVKKDDSSGYILYDGKKTESFKSSNQSKDAMYIPVLRLNKKLLNHWDVKKVAIEMIKNNLMPSKELLDNFLHQQGLRNLYKEYNAGNREISEDGDISIKYSKKSPKEILKETYQKTNSENIAKSDECKTKVNLTEDEKKLLDCDKVRFSYAGYEKDRLYDLANGHWDLFSIEDAGGKDIYKTEKGFVARNPLRDVQKNGVVAIDFGTKSTVVVYKNGSTMKMPMRIGTTDFKKEVNDAQYENPTVEEFVDIKEFVKAYSAKSGRPDTKWKDLIVANTAKVDMLDNASVLDKHYSYFSDIKQWAAGQVEAIISDQNGYMPKMGMDQKNDEELDLVEIYAYFIGLHINNMNNGIFLNYKLSFPVSFDVEIRERIRRSFETGLRKSIPEIVQNDEKIFKKFKVRLTASEPAAYAACAIQQFKINVPENHELFYSVFDFGGGTSDFDFGLWKECDDEYSNYTYELQRITSVGDNFLGGENLLAYLAFEVFKKNADLMKANDITFTKPIFCERFRGDEAIVKEPPTRIASRNMYVVKEKLREFWEGNYEDFLKEPEKNISVELMNSNTIAKNNIHIKVNYQDLYNILKNRIAEGVNKFESGRRKALRISESRRKGRLADFQCIFMAGNSCKSSIVLEIFKEKYSEMLEKGEMKIFPPLRSTEVNNNQLFAPNGKTGVAWGLLDIGDSVKFTDNKLSDGGNIEFKFSVGIAKKGIFIPKLKPSDEYGRWIKLAKGNQDEISVFYTDNCEATEGNYSVDNVDVKCFTYNIDDPEDDKWVFVRMVDSTTINISCNAESMCCDRYIRVVDECDSVPDEENVVFDTIDLKDGM